LEKNLGAQITQPLSDLTVTETRTALLECRVAREGVQGHWLKDGREVERISSDRYRIQQEGCINRLRISDTVIDDAGKFTFQFGNISTTARLTVSGITVVS